MMRLWQLAAHYALEHQRVHLEWVWTGERIYVVQLDAEEELLGTPPSAAWRGETRTLSNVHCTVLRPIAELAGTSQKIRVQHTYGSLGLPTVPIFAVEGADIVRSLSDADFAATLLSDLDMLVKGGVVCRGDADGEQRLLLPKSNTLTDAADVYHFLTDSVQILTAKAGSVEAWRVLIHAFIPSTASAWAYAVPHSSRVRIDAIWGVPAGLDWGRHDTFEVDARDGNTMRRNVRCKDTYLDVQSDGEWSPVTAGAPWDWKASLQPSQRAFIAQGTRAIAEREGAPVHAMWLAGVRPDSGYPDCIPWFHHTNPGGVTLERSAYHQPAAVIRTRDDLSGLDNLVATGSIRPGAYIEVNPRPELIRDDAFVRDLADASAQYKLVIVIDGSPLSHAYYTLKREGAGVVCRDVMPDDPGAPRYFGKLVRDLVPTLIETRGERATTMRVAGDETLQLIKQKLIEEAFEVQATSTLDDMLAELADVWEVVSALAQRSGVSLATVGRMARAKRRTRGGFRTGVVLVKTETRPMQEAYEHGTGIAGDRPSAPDEQPLFSVGEGGTVRSIAATSARPILVSPRSIRAPLVPPMSADNAFRIDLQTEVGTAIAAVRIGYEGPWIAIHLDETLPPTDENQLELDFTAGEGS